MNGEAVSGSNVGKRWAWLALMLLPLLTSCIGAVALPLLAGGTLTALKRNHVRAATQVPGTAAAPAKSKHAERPDDAALSSSKALLSDLHELPPPSGVPSVVANDPWQRFVAYTLTQTQPTSPGEPARQAALLIANPPLDVAKRRDCTAPVPAVIIDLDSGQSPFDPSQLSTAPAALVEGLSRLRQAGIVVLWISQLPATQASGVAQALRTSGLDPQRQDQLLLLRSSRDRKQLLREDANDDVCVVAIAGDKPGDFDELFDYLRNPDAAFGLQTMIGAGWFLTPPLTNPATGSTER